MVDYLPKFSCYRSCRFPFIACEIFTCEIDVIFKTLVEDEEVLSRYPFFRNVVNVNGLEHNDFMLKIMSF